jgi:hypothetical protein
MKKFILGGFAAAAVALGVGLASAAPANASPGSWNSNSPYGTMAVDAAGNPMMGWGNVIVGPYFKVLFADNPNATWVSCTTPSSGTIVAHLGERDPDNGLVYTGVRCYT